MTDRNSCLLSDIDAFLGDSGMAEATFGRYAVNDGKLIARLRAGRRVWPETAEKIREYIRSQTNLQKTRPANAAEREVAGC